MNYQLALFRQNRHNIIHLLEAHSLEQVNTISSGFNNNILWHAGHLLLAQQLLVYALSKLPMQIPQELMECYKSGTVPSGAASQEEFEQIITLLKETTEQTIQDIQNGLFKEYVGYSSEYFGITMTTTEEAFQFNNAHESFHFGQMGVIRTALHHR